MANEIDIKNELKSVNYPGFEKSIVDFDFIKNIKIVNNSSCIINIDIPSSSKEVEEEIRTNVISALNKIGIQRYDY